MNMIDLSIEVLKKVLKTDFYPLNSEISVVYYIYIYIYSHYF